tara:strand:+ start:1061 stop:1636 length:576 start_codon:yes stop_codon:yes gene_type:complete
MSNSGVFDVNDIRYLMDYQQWPTPGELQLIETQTVSSVSAVNFQSLGNFSVHFLTLNNIESSTNNIRYGLRFYENGVLETGSNYKWAYLQQLSSNADSDFYEDSWTSIPIQLEQSTGFNGGGYSYLYNLLDSTQYSYMTNQHIRVSNSMISEFGAGVMTQQSTVDGFQISGYDSSTPNFSGVMSLYGIGFS